MANRFLLDTHAFLWSLSSSERLSAQAQEAILESKNELFISRISYWEINPGRWVARKSGSREENEPV